MIEFGVLFVGIGALLLAISMLAGAPTRVSTDGGEVLVWKDGTVLLHAGGKTYVLNEGVAPRAEPGIDPRTGI